MNCVGIILARAGSKGLPDKCVRPLCGRAVIEYTFEHAQGARRLDAVVLTTDSEPAKALARQWGIEVIDRPADLAGDAATVDAAARHAIESWEARHGKRVDAVVLLYGNIPVRGSGLIDRAIEHLGASGADSVRSVAPVSKQHPDWVHRLDGDRMSQYRPNSIYRRQDLTPLYYHDGTVAAVTRRALFGATPGDHQSFLGSDRRAIVCDPEDAVDVDGPIDLLLAEAILKARAKSHQETEERLDGCSQTHPARRDGFLAFRTRKDAARFADGALAQDEPGVFIIAEAGVNHDGSLEKAMRLVDAAFEAGADAVKFQMFCAAELASSAAAVAPYQEAHAGNQSQRDLLAGLELSAEQFRGIHRHCKQRGIVFLATPFGISELRQLAELGAPAIKIASTDLTNLSLIDAAIDTDLALILSTGAATQEEIQATFEHIRRRGAAGRLVLLHCVSAYPTPVEALNLGALATLAESFNVPVGLSDHTTSVETGGWAAAAGACVLEKHLTLDCGGSGPDHATSLGPAQMSEYVRRARSAAAARGWGRLGFQPIEQAVREVARRSVTAAVDIAAGTVLSAAMLTLKRPGAGIAPSDLRGVIGRRIKRAVAADTALRWDMIES